ncbi:MAG: hypothetical protein HQL49_02225 [Gammaproteobacteria bacterium]|nr:hypothetical protein [Gammaproteobacteria bacterium]
MAHSKTWSADDVDTFITCGAREVLEKNLHRLSVTQIGQLKEADAAFMRLLEQVADKTGEAADLQRLADSVISVTDYRHAA